ncbi:response regulator [Aliifodinibius sp. S!AR15-10]|uniref:response regulator n=1 Tax=Aliifodinibius sp. S!AR15-10 TaxID=2950437 RepID=UPI002862AA80|nr:response regulator [Aliifodinibius sp. S!AR15-10]MDR8391266.1 response regulator [Aliifodinibius sp. S!AR15-10]
MKEAVQILLVEDNKNDAELAMRTLKKNNISNQVFWVKDGAQAIDFLFAKGEFSERNINHTPKVVLLDLKLPKKDGIEVLREIRNSEELKQLPVVMLTSSKEEKDMVKSYDLGVNSYIVKPIDFDDFTKAIKDLGYYWLVMNQSPKKVSL